MPRKNPCNPPPPPVDTRYRTLSSVVVEIKLAGSVRVAGHAQVIRVTKVRAEFDRVLPAEIGPIVHELILVFLFIKRAIALIHVKRVTKKELISPARLLNRKGWHA